MHRLYANTMPFYIRDLEIHGFWDSPAGWGWVGESGNQFPADSKGWLYSLLCWAKIILLYFEQYASEPFLKPDWNLQVIRFGMESKASRSSPPDSSRGISQSLLSERFVANSHIGYPQHTKFLFISMQCDHLGTKTFVKLFPSSLSSSQCWLKSSS